MLSKVYDPKPVEAKWSEAWHGEYGGTILGRLRKLGCALHFSAENVRFTMDKPRAAAVFEAFRSLWEKSLVYRRERMRNWCTSCGTGARSEEMSGMISRLTAILEELK